MEWGDSIDTLRLIQDGVLVAFVLAVIYTDWRFRRIPNAFTYPAILVGLGLSAVSGLGAPFASGFLDHLAAAIVAFVLAYPFYAGGGVKAGDVKLLMAVGALRGSAFLLPAAFYGVMLGGLIALVFIVLRRLARPAPGEPPNTMRNILHGWIPYGIALGSGALIALALERSGTLVRLS